MRTAINNLVAFLRHHRDSITDGMIEAVWFEIDGTKVMIMFSSEAELVAFGTQHISDAQVEKVLAAEGTHYKATLVWRKRTIRILMRVDASVGVPASRVFSGEPK